MGVFEFENCCAPVFSSTRCRILQHNFGARHSLGWTEARSAKVEDALKSDNEQHMYSAHYSPTRYACCGVRSE